MLRLHSTSTDRLASTKTSLACGGRAGARASGASAAAGWGLPGRSGVLQRCAGAALRASNAGWQPQGASPAPGCPGGGWGCAWCAGGGCSRYQGVPVSRWRRSGAGRAQSLCECGHNAGPSILMGPTGAATRFKTHVTLPCPSSVAQNPLKGRPGAQARKHYRAALLRTAPQPLLRRQPIVLERAQSSRSASASLPAPPPAAAAALTAAAQQWVSSPVRPARILQRCKGSR